jgi:hypothetical protein
VAPIKNFAPGERVLHAKHGLGRIIGVEEGIATLVDFGSVRVRVAAPYTSMDKL